MDFRPIRTELDYQEALQEVERLFNASPNTPSHDRLDILCTLIDSYEKAHHPIELPDPIEAIHYYMDALGLSLNDLARYLGGRSVATNVLSRRCSLTLEMIRQLNKELGIPAEILIQQYEPTQVSA